MNRFSPYSLALVLAGICTQAQAGEDLLLNDFEAKDYGNWKVTGTAFGPGPAQGTLKGQMLVSGFQGKGLVNTFFNGDSSTGTLTSPEWTIERKYVRFLIGGGKDSEKLALQLLVDGKVVRSSTGPNDKPGGSEELSPDLWDVTDWIGKKGIIRIIDGATGPWGHINVDHIVQTDRKPATEVKEAQREFQITTRYLNIPIRNGAKKRVVTLVVNGQPVVRNDIELADDRADWWAPMEVAAWKGKTVTLKVDRLREDSGALRNIEPSDSIKDRDQLYREALRGQLHFSPQRGWNNDPNGMVYFNGEYHLFFQHNPYGWGWGNMHWGHAVSKDLIHWEELGDKLLPDNLGPMFSGSAVVDTDNTSGFGQAGKPPLVLIYTAAGNPTVQCIAYSTDGRSFTKYNKNPVIPQVTPGNRDPKVIWHAPTRKWVMVLYVTLKGKHTVHFYTSPNLKEWTLASVHDGGTDGKNGYLYECPDFFELNVDGDSRNRKWVLLGANSEYAVGDFDGKLFKPEKTWIAGQHGRGFYAPQTFSDIPDGRRIQIGWFQTNTPGMPFNQSMTIPHELQLTATADGPRLVRMPVKELEKLRLKSTSFKPVTLRQESKNPLVGLEAELLELQCEIEPVADAHVMLSLRGVEIVYDSQKKEISLLGHRAKVPLKNGKLQLTIYVDRTGLEIFAAGGLVYIPAPVNLKSDNRESTIRSLSGEVKIHTMTVHILRSIWK